MKNRHGSCKVITSCGYNSFSRRLNRTRPQMTKMLKLGKRKELRRLALTRLLQRMLLLMVGPVLHAHSLTTHPWKCVKFAITQDMPLVRLLQCPILSIVQNKTICVIVLACKLSAHVCMYVCMFTSLSCQFH